MSNPERMRIFILVELKVDKTTKRLQRRFKVKRAYLSHDEAMTRMRELNSVHDDRRFFLKNARINGTNLKLNGENMIELEKTKQLASDLQHTVEDLKQMTIEMQHEIDGQYSQLLSIEKLLEDDIRDEETTEDAIERIVKDSRIVGLQRHFAKLAGYLDDNRRMHEEHSQPSKKFKVTGEPKGWSYTETLAEDLSEAHAVEAMKGAFAAGYRRVKIIEQIEEEPE